MGTGFIARVARTDVTPADLLDPIASESLGFTPGAHYAYSNTNYLLLGMLLEKLTNEPYETDLARSLLVPERLDDISYGRPGGDDVAVGYAPNGPEPQWTSAVLRGAGALWGTADDLLRFDAAFFGHRILPPAMVSQMTAASDAELGSFAYAFGWMISDVGGHRQIWHGGGVPGFTARNSVFPDDRLGIVVLANATAFDETPIVRGILALLDPGVSTRAEAVRTPLDDPGVAALAAEELREFQRGSVDPSRYRHDLQAGLTAETVAGEMKVLAPLGTPSAVTLRERTYLGNLQRFVYRLRFAAFAIDELLTLDGDGEIAGIYFLPARLP